MNAATCQVLATVFPIVMLTVVLERRMISIKLRRLPWFRNVMLWSFGSALLGVGITLVGVQTNGLPLIAGVTAWMLAALSIGGLGAVLMASMATTEVEEDTEG
ncbi:hypothetical protein LG299_12470 [Microbacterium lacus]|uniref:hypothetical protein n=1 Tax=Microbacterium lacus TaxID=415217 RepID=UPI00384BB142